MGQSLEEAILTLYAAHDDTTKHFANPHIIDGLGCSDRFGWPPHGWSHYSMFHLLEPALSGITGQILEIGALVGAFTRILCDFAAKNKKFVYVVDPWNGDQQGTGSKHIEFQKNTKEWQGKTLFVMRSKSDSEAAKRLYESLQLSFAWVDGMHTYEAAKKDIENIKASFPGPGIIGMDDLHTPFGFSAGLLQACRDAGKGGWQFIEPPASMVFGFLVKE